MSSRKPQRPSPATERVGLIITNLTKLAGIAIAINEALIEQSPREGALAVAALMMAGAQALENTLRSFFGGRP